MEIAKKEMHLVMENVLYTERKVIKEVVSLTNWKSAVVSVDLEGKEAQYLKGWADFFGTETQPSSHPSHVPNPKVPCTACEQGT